MEHAWVTERVNKGAGTLRTKEKGEKMRRVITCQWDRIITDLLLAAEYVVHPIWGKTYEGKSEPKQIKS